MLTRGRAGIVLSRRTSLPSAVAAGRLLCSEPGRLSS